MAGARRQPVSRAALVSPFAVVLGLVAPGARADALAQRDAGRPSAETLEQLVAELGQWSAESLAARAAARDPDADPPAAELEPATKDELQRTVVERDASIAELLQRVEKLEEFWANMNIAGVPAGDRAPPAPTATAGQAPPTAPPPRSPARPPATRAASAQAAARPAEPVPPAPGQFEVDEEAIDQALERALVQTGALLLPPGSAEIEHSISYSRGEDEDPLFFRLTAPDGTELTTAGTRGVRRNDVVTRAALRTGLPYDFQAEIGVPYRYRDVSTVESSASTRREVGENGWGLGDVEVGFAKGLLRESGWRPDLIGRVQWDTDTGQTDDGIVLGSGFHEVRGSLTAVKRQDPLVFVGSLGYETAFEDDGVDPGDEVTVSFGTVLAASPETSLRFFLQQSFTGEAEAGGREVPGSDQVDATFVVGASSIIAPQILLDVTAGIGVTDDGTDYTLTVSLPIQLNFGDLRFPAGF